MSHRREHADDALCRPVRRRDRGFRLPLAASLSALLVAYALAEQPVSAMGITFHVASNGDDRWSGELDAPSPDGADGPFATLHRAQVAVRRTLRDGEPRTHITVEVRDGFYRLDRPLVLDRRDSGAEGASVIWRARAGEHPIISGGRVIADWRTHDTHIMRADLSTEHGERWIFRQLFLLGRRQVRARAPNLQADDPLHGGWAYMEGVAGSDAFQYDKDLLPGRLSQPTAAEVYFFAGPMGSWGSNLVPVHAIDYEKRVLRIRYGAGHDQHMGFNGNVRYRIENAIELIDQPGEWCLAGAAGVVYFWPPEGTGDIVADAPHLDSLMMLDHAAWITVSGFTFTQTRAMSDAAALVLENVTNVTIAQCRFDQVGHVGMSMRGVDGGASSENVLSHNEFAECGASGIYVGGKADSNQIVDNRIERCGVFNKYAAGIEFPFYGGTKSDVSADAFTDGNLVAHNELSDLPRDGIMLGANPYGRNTVEYNVVRRVCLETIDAAAIRVHLDGVADNAADLSRIPPMVGHVIRHNLVVDAVGCGVVAGRIVTPNLAFGIYLDDLSANCIVYGNVVVRAAYGLWSNAGRKHTIENNVFAECRNQVCFSVPPHLHDDRVYAYATGNRVVRNVFSIPADAGSNSPVTFHSDFGAFDDADQRRRTVAASDYNVVFDPAGGKSGLEEWLELGFDTHSSTADPLFIDPAADDYGLDESSPAVRLGVDPTRPADCGIRP